MLGALFNPTPSTIIRAIKKGHFTPWPGLGVNLITKSLPKNIATIKEHLDQERMNLQSTKSLPRTSSSTPSPSNSIHDKINSPQDAKNKPSSNIMCMVINTNTKCQSHTVNRQEGSPSAHRRKTSTSLFYHYKLYP